MLLRRSSRLWAARLMARATALLEIGAFATSAYRTKRLTQVREDDTPHRHFTPLAHLRCRLGSDLPIEGGTIDQCFVAA